MLMLLLNCLDCPSKECFRKVANFERFLRLYAQKNQHLTQFECVLRDVSDHFNQNFIIETQFFVFIFFLLFIYFCTDFLQLHQSIST